MLKGTRATATLDSTDMLAALSHKRLSKCYIYFLITNSPGRSVGVSVSSNPLSVSPRLKLEDY